MAKLTNPEESDRSNGEFNVTPGISASLALAESARFKLRASILLMPTSSTNLVASKKAREAAARIYNATVDEVLVTRNTTEGLNIVLLEMEVGAIFRYWEFPRKVVAYY